MYSLYNSSMQSLHPLHCYSSIIESHPVPLHFNLLLRNIESLTLTFQSITEFLTARRYGFFYASILYNKQVILPFLHPMAPRHLVTCMSPVGWSRPNTWTSPNGCWMDHPTDVPDHSTFFPDHPTFGLGQTQFSLGAQLKRYLLGL